jgi:hypothetical protein
MSLIGDQPGYGYELIKAVEDLLAALNRTNKTVTFAASSFRPTNIDRLGSRSV